LQAHLRLCARIALLVGAAAALMGAAADPRGVRNKGSVTAELGSTSPARRAGTHQQANPRTEFSPDSHDGHRRGVVCKPLRIPAI